MKCDKCQILIPDGEARELHGQNLCEDCYIDEIAKPKTCDPWAVYQAKSGLTKHSKLTQIQLDILDALKDNQGLELEVLSDKLKRSPSDIEREIATLRHMEKVKGKLKDGKKLICLW